MKEKTSQLLKKHWKFISLLLTSLIILIIGIVALSNKEAKGNNNGLTGNDLNVYRIVLEVSIEFKDPSSVRVESGSLTVNGDGGWLRLAAKNSYGTRGTDSYFISRLDDDKLYIFKEEDAPLSYWYVNTNDFNIEKVNMALVKHWSSIGF